MVLTSISSYALREGRWLLVEGEIIIPEFIRSLRTLTVYGIAPSLPLGGVGRDLPFIENDTFVTAGMLFTSLVQIMI